MSRKRRERRRAVAVRPQGGPEYSPETLRRITELTERMAGSGDPGPHKVAVLHEQFCADALRRGAKKCLCHPEIKVVTAGEVEERFRKAYENHWLTREGHEGQPGATPPQPPPGGNDTATPDAEPFIPTSKPAVVRLIVEAARTNAGRDKIDRDAGFAAPGDAGLPSLMRTAISAIVSGMETETWPAVAEGLVMLMQAEVAVRLIENHQAGGNPDKLES